MFTHMVGDNTLGGEYIFIIKIMLYLCDYEKVNMAVS